MRNRAARLTTVVLFAVAAGCSSGDGSTATDPSAVASSNGTDGTSSETSAPISSGVPPTSGPPTGPATTTPSTAGRDPAATTTPGAGGTAPDGTTTDTTISTATSDTTTPTPTLPLSDEARGDIQLAESALLDLSSLPDGWTATPASEGTDNEEFERRFDECFGRSSDSPTEILTQRNADSDEFSGPGDTRPSVEHTVSMAPDEAVALLAMKEVATEGAGDCLAAVVQEFFEAEFADDADVPDGLTLGRVTIERTDDGSVPDTRVGYRLEVPLSLDGESFSQFLDVLYQRSGRAVSNLQFSSFALPFPADGVEALAAVVDVDLTRIGT